MKTCYDAWELMSRLTTDGPIRNFTCEIDMADFTIVTDMFPRDALIAYSAYNMGQELTEEQKKFFNAARGGKQGDYREGIERKISNVVDCLRHFPKSKRALITICNNPFPSHKSDDDAKCMREIHFYIEDQKLNASVFFRAQAAQIFPKNIHFIGSLMSHIALSLADDISVGSLHYHTSILVSDRS